MLSESVINTLVPMFSTVVVEKVPSRLLIKVFFTLNPTADWALSGAGQPNGLLLAGLFSRKTGVEFSEQSLGVNTVLFGEKHRL